MKKIFSMTLLSAAALAFTGCAGEEDDIFSSSAANRLDQSKVTYTERLKSAADGWAMEYYPTKGVEGVQGKGYLLLMKFNDDESVRMAMKNEFSGGAYLEDESAWQVIADNGPVLTFNTYNDCIHAFCDPKETPSLGLETGRGGEGDYEFVIIDLGDNAASAMLKGKKRGTYDRLTRLEEGVDFRQYIEDVQAFGDRMFSASAPNGCVVTLGDSVMSMADASTGIPNIYPYGGDPILQESYHPYLITKRGGKYYMRFRDGMYAPDGTAAQEFVDDEGQDMFTGVEHPEFTIEGEEPAKFFMMAMEDGNTWRLSRTSDMSDDMKAKYEAVRTGFTSLRYTMNYIYWTLDEGQLMCVINLRTNRNATVNASYKFSMTPIDGGYTLSYDGPADTAASTIFSSVPAISNLFAEFTADFAVNAATTKFNLSNITFLTGETKWFTITRY